jgi:hypothetical protein
MRYRITWPRLGLKARSPSTVVTSDERVIAATPAFEWAIGKSYYSLEQFCRREGLRLTIVGYDSIPETSLKKP